MRHLIDGADLSQGADEAIENYTTGGRTALYDAVCTGIDELGRKFAAQTEAERPDAIVFAILTDGFENASREFGIADVKARIDHQSSKYNWEFRFLAANQDAVLSGARIGVARAYCKSFAATDEGLCESGKMLSRACMYDIRSLARQTRAQKRKYHYGQSIVAGMTSAVAGGWRMVLTIGTRRISATRLQERLCVQTCCGMAQGLLRSVSYGNPREVGRTSL